MTHFKKILISIIFSAATNLAVFSQSKITSIQGKLFYNEKKSDPEVKDMSGTFSQNIIDNGNFALWNTIIGEGSAEGYSNQTIVVVEVTCKGQGNKKQILKLSSIAGKKIVQQQRIFSCVEDQSKYKLLFLLNDTGCETVKLKAELMTNGKSVSVMNKSIGFACGE